MSVILLITLGICLYKAPEKTIKFIGYSAITLAVILFLNNVNSGAWNSLVIGFGLLSILETLSWSDL